MTTALHGGTAPLAALTTVFTPPCPTSWLVTTTKLPSQFPSFPAADVAATTCDPPAWASNLAGEGFQYYSPAICPDGFQVGAGCILTGTPRTTEGFPAVAAGETVAWCVPSGQSCTSDTTDFRGGIWGVSRTATGAGVTVTVGPAIQIRFRDVDLSILATHPLTPGLTLAGATTTASSTPTPTPTPPAKLTPNVASSSPQVPQTTQEPPSSSPSPVSSSSSSSASAIDGAAAGFVTLKGKPTTASPSSSPEPITSTVQVVSYGSTFMSTVVTSPTAAPAVGGSSDASTGGTASSSTSNAAARGSPTRAFIATIVMAVILSVAAAAIMTFFLLSRRRFRKQQQQKIQKGRGILPETEPSDSDGSSSIGWSSVGVGAWVHRKRPRPRTVWRRTGAWWSGVRLLPWKKRSPLTGDNRSWGRRRPSLPEQQNQNVSDLEASRAITPMAELPTSERALADLVELEGSPVPEIQEPHDNDGDDDDADSYKSIQKFKGIPARRLSVNSTTRANRFSWMSRLSRYMRGRPSTAGGDGRDTPASMSTSVYYDDAATVADRSVLSRASTRSSRWTRAGDADDSAFGNMDSGDFHESSWKAFSQSREGLSRLLLAKRNAGSPDPMPASFGARRGHQRGLSVPTNGTAKGLPRLPSPAITVRSERTGTPGPGWLSANGGGGGNTNRFSRLSSGTFGRMDSFISRDGSRIGDMPSGNGGGGTQSTEANL